MKRLFFILTLLLTSIAKGQTPNVLLIIADDLGVDAFNGYSLGAFDPITPHLDSIRNSGLTFSNVWSSPVCTPTRAGIMSGMYGSKNNVKTAPGNLDTSFVSLLKAVKETNNQYSTAVIGKWHISKPVEELHPIWHGADHYMGIMSGGVAQYDNWDKTENNVTTNSTDYITSYLTDDAINWIDNQSNPWFLWLAHVAPHTPLHIPPSYMYSQPTTNSQIKKYMAMIESIDYEVGRLLDSMTAIEKANTTIIFIGDNGTPNNVLQEYPSGHGKETLYQGGIHVPMIVSGFGVTRNGETEDALVNVVDIYASVLEMIGADLPGGKYNSLSFKHLLSASESPKREYNFSELDSNNVSITTQGYAIRNSTYKLIKYHNGQEEMFNLENDPLELTNIIFNGLSPEEELVKADLEAEANQRINAWSCNDDIQNGDEEAIDCGGTFCSPCSASIQDLSSKIISIHPNPVSDILTIELNENSLVSSVELYSLEGQLIQSKNLSPHTYIHKIDLSNYSKGVYFISFLGKEKTTLKIIKH